MDPLSLTSPTPWGIGNPAPCSPKHQHLGNILGLGVRISWTEQTLSTRIGSSARTMVQIWASSTPHPKLSPSFTSLASFSLKTTTQFPTDAHKTPPPSNGDVQYSYIRTDNCPVPRFSFRGSVSSRPEKNASMTTTMIMPKHQPSYSGDIDSPDRWLLPTFIAAPMHGYKQCIQEKATIAFLDSRLHLPTSMVGAYNLAS